MKFRKPFERLVTYSEPGDPFHVEYQGYYDKEGNLQLKEVGKTDIYTEIQSHKDSTDINVLLAKYRNGDENALNRVQGYYSDITDIPDIHSLYNLFKTAEQDFQRLPVEVRQAFDNSFEKYIFTAGSDEWFKKTGLYPVEQETPKDEVNADGE